MQKKASAYWYDKFFLAEIALRLMEKKSVSREYGYHLSQVLTSRQILGKKKKEPVLPTEAVAHM